MSDVVATGILNIQAQVDTAQLDKALQGSTSNITAHATKAADSINNNFTKSFKGVATASNSLVNTVTKGLGNALSSISTSFKVFGGVAAASIAGVLGESIRLGVSLNELEAASKAAFTGLTGSATIADALLQKVNQTAEANPFLNKDVFLSSTKNLLAFGVAAKDIPGTLQAIADVEGAVGGGAQGFQSIVEILGRVRETGTLSNRALVGLANQGIPAVQIIAQQLGKTQDQVRAGIKSGAISGKQAGDALLKGFVTQFGPVADQFSKTLPGAVQIFKNSLADLGATLTKAFVNPSGGGAAVTLFTDLAAIIQHLKEVLAPFEPIIQGFADGLARTADSAKNFISSISVTQVSKFVSTLKEIAPALLVLGASSGGLAGKFLNIIPGLGGLAGAVGSINPITAALVALGVVVPAVREQFVRIGGTLATAFKPTIDALVPTLKSFIQLISDLAKPIGDVLVNSIKDIAPTATTLVNVLHSLINVITPIARAFLSFGPIKDILEVLVIRFVALRVAGLGLFEPLIAAAAQGIAALVGVASSFGGVVTGAATTEAAITGVSAAFKGLAVSGVVASDALERATVAIAVAAEASAAAATEITVASGAMALAKTAALGLIGGLAGLLNPLNLAVAGFIIYNKIIKDAKDKQDALTKSFEQGLDPASIEGQNSILASRNKLLDDAKAKSDKINGSLLGRLNNTFPNVDPGAAKKGVDAQNAENEALKKRDDILQKIAVRNDIISNVQARTGKNAEEILAAAKANNLDIFNVNPNSEKNFIDQLVNGVTKVGTAGEAGVNAVLANAQQVSQGITAAIESAIKPIDDLVGGYNAVRTAAQSVKDANLSLAEIERTRTLLLKDIVARENEVLQANLKVVDAQVALRDLQQQRAEAVRTESERERNFAQEEAAFSDKLLQNQIDQRAAALSLVDAQRQLNFLQRQRAIGPQGLNLAGLSIDEARRRIANVTSNLANQQANNQQASLTRQVAEAQDAVTSAQIKQRDTTRQTVDLQQNNADAIHANDIALRDFAQSTAKFNEDTQKAQEAIAVAIDDQGKLQRGEIGTKETLRQLDLQRASSQRAVTNAVNDEKIAQDQLAVTLANQSGSVADQVKANQTLLADKIKQAAPNGPDAALLSLYTQQRAQLDGILGDWQAINDTNRRGAVFADITGELENAKKIIDSIKTTPIVRQSEQATLVSILNQAKPFIQNAQGNPAGLALSADQISKIASDSLDSLIANPSSNVNQILKDILAKIGLNIPGFAKGGVFDTDTIARIGEAGREVVLPLTRQANLQDLLSRPEVLNPILAALPRITLPSNLTVNNANAITAGYGSGGPSNANARIEQSASEDRMAEKFADALVRKLKSNDLGKNEVNVPITIQPHRLQNESDIANSVAREIIRRLK